MGVNARYVDDAVKTNVGKCWQIYAATAWEESCLRTSHSSAVLESLKSEAYEPKSMGDGGGAGVGSMLVVRMVSGDALKAAATSCERVRWV